MRAQRINLRLSESIKKNSLERPSSRTDQLVEESFENDSVSKCSTPGLQPYPSKALSSVSKLKDMLQKTSDKLKNIKTKKEPTKAAEIEPDDKKNEILKLRREVKILEMEKEELETANKKLKDALACYRDISTKTDYSQTLARHAKYFLSAVKQDQSNVAVFRNIFSSEDEFLARLGSENLSGLCVGLFQFCLDKIQKPVENKVSGFSEKEINDEAIKRIFLQSQGITESIINQKKKIEQAYFNVKGSIQSGRNSSLSSYSRPQSVAMSRKAETPDLGSLQKRSERSKSLKENGSDNS